VEGAGLLGVNNVALVEEVVVAELQGARCCLDLEKIDIPSYLVAEETPGDVDLLASHDYDLLAGEYLLGDDRGQSTKEVTLAINDDGCRRESGHSEVYIRRGALR